MAIAKPPRDGYAIICRGIPVEVPIRVRTWKEHGMKFIGRDRLLTRQVVNHWTGAENPPDVMFGNMLNHRNAFNAKEPLSVNFAIDKSGNIFQLADTETRCVHAGRANGYSIGIEHVGRGSDLTMPTRNVRRTRVTEVIHGVKVPYDDLTPEQIQASVQLNEALCKLYALPVCKVPEDTQGRVRLEQLTETEAALFFGSSGHLHHHESKVDPGGTLLRAIQARGRQLAAQS